jgi:hypothetical protein
MIGMPAGAGTKAPAAKEAGGHGHGGGSMEGMSAEHITKMSACFDDKLGVKELKKGQLWNLKAYYDYEK